MMFRLCLAGVGGCCHPDELLQRLTSLQVAEWLAFDSLEPIGERHRDYTIGILAALTANLSRDPKVRPEPYYPEDFMTPTIETVQKKEVKKSSVGVLELFRGLRDSLRMKKEKGE